MVSSPVRVRKPLCSRRDPSSQRHPAEGRGQILTSLCPKTRTRLTPARRWFCGQTFTGTVYYPFTNTSVTLSRGLFYIAPKGQLRHACTFLHLTDNFHQFFITVTPYLTLSGSIVPDPDQRRYIFAYARIDPIGAQTFHLPGKTVKYPTALVRKVESEFQFHVHAKPHLTVKQKSGAIIIGSRDA